MEGQPRQRSKSRLSIFALVVGLLLFACAALLRRSMAREQVERRLHETRTMVNDAERAAADSAMERGMRTQYSAALAQATVESLDRPVIAAAVVPEWKKQLILYWIAKDPGADAIEIQVDGQPTTRLSLAPEEIDANRVEARSRVLYNNAVESPELDRILAAAPPGAKMTVALVAQGKTVSQPLSITRAAN